MRAQQDAHQDMRQLEEEAGDEEFTAMQSVQWQKAEAKAHAAEELLKEFHASQGKPIRTAAGDGSSGDWLNDDSDGDGSSRIRKPRGTGMAFRSAATNQTFRAFRSGEQMFEANEDVSLGRLLWGMATGQMDALSHHEIGAINRGSDPDGAYLVNPVTSGRFIDLARSASVCVKAGVQTVPMEASEVTMVGAGSDPVAYWRHENVSVPLTSMTWTKIRMMARTLACIIPISIEMMEDATNAASLIETAMQNAMGLALDLAILGIGSVDPARPVGILETGGVNAIGGVGTPAYADITAAVGDILAANYPGEVADLAWVMHPRDAETFDGLLDTTGQPKQPTPWAAKLSKHHTTSLPSTAGGGSNESSMVIGDFSQVLLGMRQSVNFRILDSGIATDAAGREVNAITDLNRFIVAYLRADVAVLRPTWLTKLTGVTA
ncbi:MAG: phage major capsid protein [Blastocatellales bacterium]